MKQLDFKQEITNRFLQAMNEIVFLRLRNCDTAAAFALLMGIKKQNLSSMGNDRYATTEQLAKICKLFSVSPSWLLLGEGQLFTIPKRMMTRPLPVTKTVTKKAKKKEKIKRANNKNLAH